MGRGGRCDLDKAHRSLLARDSPVARSCLHGIATRPFARSPVVVLALREVLLRGCRHERIICSTSRHDERHEISRRVDGSTSNCVRGLQSVSSEQMDSSTLEMVSAGDQLSLRMSRQMAPAELILQ